MSVTTVTPGEVLDGMAQALTALAPSGVAPGATGPWQPYAPGAKYLRSLGRYMGGEFDRESDYEADDMARRGISGRTPAMRVAFAGEQPFRTSIGRRVDHVQGHYVAISASDMHRTPDERQIVLGMITDARRLLVARRFGLAISAMAFGGHLILREDDKMTAYGVKLSTKYYVDYSKDPGTDVLLSIDGEIVLDNDQLPPAPDAPIVVRQGGATGSSRYAYQIEALYGTGPRSNPGPKGVLTAGALLGGGVANRLDWAALPNATGYRVWRVEAPAPLTVGAIATVSTNNFTDDGSLVGDGALPPTRGLRVKRTF